MFEWPGGIIVQIVPPFQRRQAGIYVKEMSCTVKEDGAFTDHVDDIAVLG